MKEAEARGGRKTGRKRERGMEKKGKHGNSTGIRREREKARGRQEETEIESSPDFLFFFKGINVA